MTRFLFYLINLTWDCNLTLYPFHLWNHESIFFNLMFFFFFKEKNISGGVCESLLSWGRLSEPDRDIISFLECACVKFSTLRVFLPYRKRNWNSMDFPPLKRLNRAQRRERAQREHCHGEKNGARHLVIHPYLFSTTKLEPFARRCASRLSARDVLSTFSCSRTNLRTVLGIWIMQAPSATN